MKKYLFSIFLPLLAIVCACAGVSSNDEPEKVTLTVHTPNITVYGDAVPSNISFTCNGKWTISSENDWITLSESSGKGSDRQQEVTFVPADNIDGVERVGLIEIMAKDCYEIITVTQLPSSMNSISNFFARVYTENFSKVYVCAHRANTWEGIYQDYIPENSIPAIEKCIALGVDMVELDIRKTKDGVLVCCHDADIASVTNGSGNVADLTYAEILAYDMKSREKGVVTAGLKMPTLEQVLLVCKDRIWVNLDLAKTAISPSEVISVVKKAGMLDQVTCYTGSNVDLGKMYYNLCDRLSIHLSISSSSGISSISGTKTVPLFQLNYSQYWDGTTVSTTLSETVRRLGRCSFSNLLNYDSKVMSGNLDALQAFCAARIDFIQTDIAGHPDFENYLMSAGLR